MAWLWPGLGAAAPLTQPDRPPIEYTISLPAPQTQMVEMSMLIREVRGDTLDVALPIWRPGRYIVLDPAATLREVRAADGAGRPLTIEKIRKSVWRIATHGADTVRINYRIYANSLGDRTRHVDDTHAFLSGESVFMYPVDRRGDPIRVHIDAPQNWRIACGLEFAAGSDDTVIAPNYDVLIDSPFEIGVHELIDFEVEGVPHEIVFWGECTYDEKRLVEDFTKIIEAQKQLWGRFPYRRYVFLAHVGKGAGGGTEHLNSTIMQTSREAIEGSRDNNDAYRRFLGLVSHEFFHTWNVKQLRPAGIVPYDYLTENYTKLLWVAEGTTSYYDDLILARTGLIKTKKYFDMLAEQIDRFRRRPARRVQSLEDASFNAWIQFARSTPDDANAKVSFYSKGALVSLLLDMEIRKRTANRENLDHVLRTIWERFPLEGGGYTTRNLIDTVESIAQSDFTPFFSDNVRGTAELDFDAALAVVGLELYFKPAKKDDEDEEGATEDTEKIREKSEEVGNVEEEKSEENEGRGEIPIRADLGITMRGTTVRSVLSDGPAYAAGLLAGDEILAINGRRLSSGQLDKRLKNFEAGEEIAITFFRHDDLREMKITLGAQADGEWKIRRVKQPTDTQKAAYESWLAHPWPGEKKEEATEDVEED